MMTDEKKPESVEVIAHVQFKCPWCNKLVIAGESEDCGMVAHQLPQCKTFVESEPVDFLRKVRMKWSN